MREKTPCVYLMANRRNGTIYTGVTSDLPKRVTEPKRDLIDGFTKKYQTHLLVYYEVHDTMMSAIEREKQIKAGSRKKNCSLLKKTIRGGRIYTQACNSGLLRPAALASP